MSHRAAVRIYLQPAGVGDVNIGACSSNGRASDSHSEGNGIDAHLVQLFFDAVNFPVLFCIVVTLEWHSVGRKLQSNQRLKMFDST